MSSRVNLAPPLHQGKLSAPYIQFITPEWRDGVRAFHSGLTPVNCPVDPITRPVEHQLWHEGWLFAAQSAYVDLVKMAHKAKLAVD